MSHGGGGGFGHGGGGGHHGHAGGHGVGLPEQLPTWSSEEEAGRGYRGFFGNITVGKFFAFLFIGLILWLFVVYGVSHQQRGHGTLADLRYFPTNKYAYSIEAASGQAAWEHDPQKPISLRLETQTKESERNFDSAPEATKKKPALAFVPTQEDLLAESAPNSEYSFKAAFGTARAEGLPNNILPNVWNMFLGRKDDELIPLTTPVTSSPISSSAEYIAATSRLDLETSLGEVARVDVPHAAPSPTRAALPQPDVLSLGSTHPYRGSSRKATAQVQTPIALPFPGEGGAPPPSPQIRQAALPAPGIVNSGSTNRYVQSTTRADGAGILRTRMIVSR